MVIGEAGSLTKNDGVIMNAAEVETLKKISLVFKSNQKEILDNWTMAVKKAGIIRTSEELNCFRDGFDILLTDFSYYLSKEDLDGYYRANKIVARKLANNDVSFSKFVKAFHLFEESYKDHVVASLPIEVLADTLGTIDLLHHETISIVSEVYLDIKDVAVFALARLAELRDPETGQHLERTREYSATLAKYLGQSEDFVNLIYRVGPLHDIGKVGIRDSLLLKPGPLTSSEYEEMKTHCAIGAATIQRIIDEQKVSNGYFLMAKQIILYHHEQYDGNGYPEGLKGDEIPLAARIFALADTYDAIVSKRPYKDPLPHEIAVSKIKQGSGSRFDPAIVKAFLEIHPLFEAIKNKYQDYGKDNFDTSDKEDIEGICPYSL